MKNIHINFGLIFSILLTLNGLNAQNKTTQQDSKQPHKTTEIKPKAYKTLPQQSDNEPKNAKEIWMEENQIYTVVDNPPSFQGGNSEMYSYLSKELKYPVEAKAKKVSGKVIMQFTVEKDGSLSDINVVKDNVGYGAAEEATRVIQKMPNWIPGKNDGKNIRVKMTLPITFKA